MLRFRENKIFKMRGVNHVPYYNINRGHIFKYDSQISRKRMNKFLFLFFTPAI